MNRFCMPIGSAGRFICIHGSHRGRWPCMWTPCRLRKGSMEV